MTIAWDENQETNIVGYKLHYGPSGGNYAYTVDVGNHTSCSISGLAEGTTYYFAATAYDTQNNESGLSEELVHTIPVPPPPPANADTDGDGIIDNDEINIYGTDPNKADTDSDGINDGEELIFWGDNWNADIDGDSLINLLDIDSDGDGYSDSQEIIDGYDPSNSNSKPDYTKIWLEAENGNMTSPFEIGDDANASSTQFAWVPTGTGRYLNLSDQAGYAEYVFEVPHAGEYLIWGRISAPNSDDDSFFVSIDGNNYALWDMQQDAEWVWDLVSDRDGADPVSFYLDAGEHTLIIKHREDGAKIDKILITDDMEFIPE